MRTRLPFAALGLIVGLVFNAAMVVAWTGPQNSPPICVSGQPGCDPPINVGTSAQIKNGQLGTNSLTAYGDLRLNYGWNPSPSTITYLNFSNAQYPTAPTWGLNGYGIRDNAGTLEFKNNGGSWASLQSLIFGGGGLWTAGTGGAIYYNAGNVGIGTLTPSEKLHAVTATNAGYAGYFQNIDSGGNVYVKLAGSAGSGVAATFMNGNVGIGITTDFATAMDGTTGLAIYNASFPGLSLSNASRSYLWYVSGSNFKIYDSTVNADRLTIDSSGNVGIGVAPTTDRRLNVTGTTGHAIVGISNAGGSTYYGVYGQGGATNYGGLGRADGYSFVGSGILYNSGPAQATAFTYLSDKRFKENIENLDDGLVTLMKLRPVSFTWKDVTGTQAGVDEHRAGESDIGLIAQEVEKVLPGLVHTDARGFKSVDYVKLTPILVKAIQEQQADNEKQQEEIEALREEVRALQKQLRL